MKEIHELVKILTPKKLRNIHVIGQKGSRDSKISQFYHLVYEGKAVTDDDAFSLLYENSDERGAYYKLKHQFIRRLRTTLFFVNFKGSKYNPVVRAYLDCQLLLGMLNICNAVRARTNMVLLAKSVIKIAEGKEFLAENIAARLRLANFYKIRGEVKSARAEIEQVRLLNNTLAAETEALLLWAEIGLHFVNQRASQPELASYAQRAAQQIENSLPLRRSNKLLATLSLIHMTEKMCNHDYHGAIKVIKAGLTQLELKGGMRTSYLRALENNLTLALFAAGKYVEAKTTNDELLVRIKSVELAPYDYFRAQEMAMMILLHDQKYQEAARIYFEAISQKAFARLPVLMTENWRIFRAYLEILLGAGYLTKENFSANDSFRLSRYLNSVPVYAKDKRGRNVAILISQLVLHLQRGNLDVIDDGMEALNKYRQRYLRRECDLRNRSFIRLINQVVKCNFDPHRVSARTGKIYNDFQKTAIDTVFQGYDQEILPFEILWRIILKALVKLTQPSD